MIPVLISIKEYVGKDKNIKYISVIVTTIIIILISVVFLLLINVDVNIKELEMPAVYAIERIWPDIKDMYGLMILISIFTTAISLGVSFLNNITRNVKWYNNMAILICMTSVVFSNIGFANLVSLFYPVLGVLGLLQIVVVFLTSQQ